jgi:hypothetical protein
LDARERDPAEAPLAFPIGFLAPVDDGFFAPAVLVVCRFVVFLDGFFATAAFVRAGFLAALVVGFFAALVVFRLVVFVVGFFTAAAFFFVAFDLDAGFAFRLTPVDRFLAAPITAPESPPITVPTTGRPKAVPATAPATAPPKALPAVPVGSLAFFSFSSSMFVPSLREK